MQMLKLILIPLFLLSLLGCTPKERIKYVPLSPPMDLRSECELESNDDLISVNRDSWDEMNSLLTSWQVCNESKKALVKWITNMEKEYGNKQ